MRSLSETITSFEPTSCERDRVPVARTSMNVVPRSERPRSRRITTEPRRDRSPTAGSAASKTGAARRRGCRRAAARRPRSAAARPVGRSRSRAPRRRRPGARIVTRFDCRTTCRTTDSPTPTRTAYCSGISIVSANVTTSTAFWTVPVRHTECRSAGLTCGRRSGSAAPPAPASRRCRSRHRTRRSRRHHDPGDQRRLPRPAPGRLVQRRRGERAADRHALEHARGDVRGTLADEVPRRVRVGAVGVRRSSRRCRRPARAPTNVSDSAGHDQRRGSGRATATTGVGSPSTATPRSSSVATSVQPNSAATAGGRRSTATTRPSAPTRVRSSTRISAIVASPTATLRQCSCPGDSSVFTARTTRFEPSAA